MWKWRARVRAAAAGAAMTGAMLVAGLTVGPVAHGAVPAAAVSSAQTTRPQRSLGSVSCVGASYCLSVGPYGDQIGSGSAFSQLWNGKSWRTVAVPSSKRGLGLLGVSCIPTKHCIAVGGLNFNRGTQLSEAWDGSSWRELPAPAVTGHSELMGVTCLAANWCMAVGTSGKRSVTALAQVWNGKSWTLRPPVIPAGSAGSTLSAVACIGPSNCLAGGEYTTTAHVEISLAQAWDGHSWTMLPSPSGITELHGLACPTVKVCVGVGAGTNGVDGEFSIASAVWNGTSWTTLNTPSPSKRTALQTLSSVSCTSATFCIASGSGPGPYNDGIGAGPFAEKWTGGSGWTLLSVPDPRAIDFSPAADRNSAAGLSSVSCTSRNRCIAVGGEGLSDALLAFSPFAAAWNGQRWSILRTNQVDGLFGASCASSSNCLMTGTYLDRDDVTQTLVESLNGARVRVTSPRGLSGVLSEISCPTASFCLAGRGRSAASWNGKRWTWTGAVAKTVLANNAEGVIDKLSCASAKFCMAITGVSPDTFGEFWDGKSWHNAPLVVPKGSDVLMDITGLSCARASTRCLAVGTWEADFGNGDGGTLAELWNGHAWQIQPAPGHLDLSDTISAVSCLTGTNCLALGVTLAAGPTDRLLALSWNGQHWKTTELAGKFPDTLGITDLSCPTSASCIGIGNYVVPPIRPPLKVTDLSPVWNGRTWRIVRPGGPAPLTTVSCASASECVAIGQPGTATLARLWNGRAWKAINTINP